MLAQITYEEFLDWRAFWHLPDEEPRSDYWEEQKLVMMTAAVPRKKGARAFKRADFMPDYRNQNERVVMERKREEAEAVLARWKGKEPTTE